MKRTVLAISTLILVSALNTNAQTSGGTGQGTSGQTGGTDNRANPSQTPLPPGLEKRDQLPPGLNGRDQLPPRLATRTNEFGATTNQFGGTNQFATDTNRFSTTTNAFGVITNQYLGGTNVTPTGRTNGSSIYEYEPQHLLTNYSFSGTVLSSSTV